MATQIVNCIKLYKVKYDTIAQILQEPTIPDRLK